MASSTGSAVGSNGCQNPPNHGPAGEAVALRNTVMRHLRDRTCREMTAKLLDPVTQIVTIGAAAVEAADLRHSLVKRQYFAPFPSLRLPAASVWYQFNRYGREYGIQAETALGGGILLRHVALKADDTLALPHVWSWVDPSAIPPDILADDSVGDEAAVNIAADQAWAHWVSKAYVPIAAEPTHVLTPKQHKHWLRWLFDDLTLLTLDPPAGGVANDFGPISMAS